MAFAKVLLREALAGTRRRLYYLAGGPNPWRYISDGSIRFNDDLALFQVYNEMFGMWFVLTDKAMTTDQRLRALLFK